jgi:arylformamidase
MIATIEYNNQSYKVDLSKPMDISIPLGDKNKKASAWYCSDTVIEPVVMEGFVGAVAQGGSVNFRNISFNPHGNGTHTECVGHIAEKVYSINKHMKDYHSIATVGSITPKKIGDDAIIDEQVLKRVFQNHTQAVVIRTLPNNDKLGKDYTETNPPFITVEGIKYLNSLGVKHLLIDLPSVDKEADGGTLAAHHEFWNYPKNPQLDKTITEFIYVDATISDGTYLLNLMIAPFENDATPSKPILYKLL